MTSGTMQPYLDQLYEQCLSLIKKPEALNEVNEKLDLIIKVDAKYAPAYYLQGLITFLNDDLDEVIEPWKIALSLEYKIKEVALGLSIIYLKIGDFGTFKETVKNASNHITQEDPYQKLYLELITRVDALKNDEDFNLDKIITSYKRLAVEDIIQKKDDDDPRQKQATNWNNPILLTLKNQVLQTLRNKDSIYYALILIFAIFMSRNLLKSGMPGGTDIYAHLFWVWNFWTSFLKLSYPTWTPYWYGGYPMMLTYAPFSHILSAVIAILVQNYILGTKIAFIFSFSSGAVGIYLVSREYKCERNAALVAAISYSISYHFILQATLRGSLSSCVALGLLPFSLLYIMRYYKSIEDNAPKKASYKNMVFSALFLMMVFLSHLSIGTMALMISGLYVFYMMIYDITKKRSNSVMKYGSSYILILITFLLLSSFWALPMFSYVGYSRVTNELKPPSTQSNSQLVDWVAHLPTFITNIMTRSFGWYPWYVGLSLIIFSIVGFTLSIKKYPQNFLSLLLIFSLFSASGGLPLVTNIFGINLSMLLSPFRSMAIIILCLSILTGYFANQVLRRINNLIKTDQRKKTARTILTFLFIAIIFIDFSPGLQNFRTVEISDPLLQEFQWLEDKQGLYRVYSHGVYEIQGSMERLGPIIHGQELLHGNAERGITFEMFRNVEEINWMVKHADEDPVLAERLVDALIKKFRFANVKYFVVGPGIQPITPLLDASSEFIRHEISEALDIYEVSEPTTPTQEVSRVLIIGEEGSAQIVHNHLFYCPQNFVYDIESDYDSIDLEKLSKYDLIVLYGIPQVDTLTQLEPTINEYIQNGGVALIDLSPLKTDITFLDVTGSFENLQDEVEITINPDYLTVLQGEDDYKFSKAQYYDIPWGFHTYQGLDEEIASINQYTLLGYRNIGEGRAYYLGFNLFYHIEYTKNEDERQFLNNVIEFLLEPDEVSITDIQRSTGQLSFTAEITNQSTNLLISESYFPGWKILDNQHKINYEQTRDGWILITLENGTHAISLKRFITLPYILGFATTTLTIFVIILYYYREFKPLTLNRYLSRIGLQKN